MQASISQDRFVNVVARIDTRSGEGKLLYVNPSRNAVVSRGGEANGFELVVEGAAGEELLRVAAQVRVSSCVTEGNTGALIQQDLPFVAGARRIRLLHNGQERDRYDPPEALAAAAMGVDFAPGTQPHKSLAALTDDIQPQEGVTYTIEARPLGATVWQAVAVGQVKPSFELDCNQFPGAASIDVRVLRSTGFEAQIVAQRRFEVSN